MAILGINGIKWSDLIARLGLYFQRITASGDASVTNYFSNVDSAVTGFKLVSTSPDVAETEVNITASNGTTYGQAYISPTPIGVSVINAGVWPIDYYRKVSSTVQESYLGLDYFMVNPSTLAETPLFSVESPEINDTTYTERPMSYTKEQFTVNPAHHLACRVKFRTTRPVATTGSYIVGDGRGVWLKTPLSPRHSQLRGLDWLGSGHVGNANKIFGSDADGLAKEYALTDFETQNVTNNATSGTITLAKQTVTTLTTTLTNAHTLTIIPELPTVFTNRNYSEVVLTVGATAPSITWSAPTDVVFTWTAPLGTPSAGLKINTKHKLFYDWESATSCLISRREL